MKAVMKTQAPSNLLFFDTETKPERKEKKNDAEYHYLWFGWVEYLRYENGKRTREGAERFDTIDRFWDILSKRLDKNRPLYVFAHNVCFDLTIVDFWRRSDRGDCSIDFFVIDDPPTMVGCKINGCTCYFVDTLNYWRTSLVKLGESLNYPKLEFPGYDAPKKVWDTYCRQDVSILTESVCNLIDFIQTNELGKFSLTAASLALSAYKHRFMKHEIFIHDRLHICQMERDAYYGGLVECFYVGTVKGKELHNVDVNSLYPSVMLNPFPTKLKGDAKNQPTSILRALSDQFAVVATVDIDSDIETFPKRIDKKLCMVRGTFTTSLCGPELLRAYRTKSIVRIHRIAWYEQARIFDDFIGFFWERRKHYKQRGNVVFEQFCKLLMNSLYGKFGQRGWRWIDYSKSSLRALYAFYSLDLPEEYEDGEIAPRIAWGNEDVYLIGLDHPIRFRVFHNKTQIRFPILEHHESFPLISAYVTAYGREYLRGLINDAGPANVYYCDTDSLFVSNAGFRRLKEQGKINPNELGLLKHEGSSSNVTFFCPKDYVFGDKSKIKGVRKNAEQLSPGVYKQLRFEGVRSVLDRSPEPYIKIDKVVKRFRRKYDKGTVLPNGRTEPFKLEGDQIIELF
jgi:DNA polymerase type B, organellar and viral